MTWVEGVLQTVQPVTLFAEWIENKDQFQKKLIRSFNVL